MESRISATSIGTFLRRGSLQDGSHGGKAITDIETVAVMSISRSIDALNVTTSDGQTYVARFLGDGQATGLPAIGRIQRPC
jgi:hypothetical protein